MLDALALAQDLIRRPSVTPADEGALGVLQAALEALGFRCRRLRFEAPGTAPIDNLYARIGSGSPHFCYAGHTDVVPVGARDGWSVDPFGAEVLNGRLYGRGAADMKGGIACFAAAAARFLAEHPDFAASAHGSISLLITGDEEGPAVNGTKRVLDWMEQEGERPDHCLVGEPTNPRVLGEMMKIGRRGSLTGILVATGTQGHVAYPHLADNPIPKLLALLNALGHGALDEGTAHFQPSNLQLVTVDVGNPAANVIPAAAQAVFNIRFNDIFTAESLERELRTRLDRAGMPYDLKVTCSGEAFLTPPGELSALIGAASKDVTGRDAELSTTGGTSDARFIRRLCPVVEFGLVGQTMHKTDENVAVQDMVDLTEIYRRVLERYFG